MKNKISSILEQPMDRKDFLKKMGAASLVILGLGNISKVLMSQPAPTRNQRAGYGGGSYGR